MTTVVQQQAVVQSGRAEHVVVTSSPVVHAVAAGAQGPRGPQGPPGPVGNADGALLVANRLSELAATPEAQEQAQHNIGLGLADPLAYYILAKA